MAERIGICRQALSAIENGGVFKTQTLEKPVSVLGTSERNFLHGNDTDCELITEVMLCCREWMNCSSDSV